MMPERLFEKELCYQTIMGICKRLVQQGVLSREEYDIAELKFREKYNPVFSL